MLKECPDCQSKHAVAKKTCKCGHVFLPRKSRGFKEMPIILTPGRLRQTAGRPARTKKSKDHEDDFVYNNDATAMESQMEVPTNKVKFESDDSDTGASMETEWSKESSDENEDNEGQMVKRTGKYPKRDRNKTPKYEIFQLTKKNSQPNKNIVDSKNLNPRNQEIQIEGAPEVKNNTANDNDDVQEQGVTINVDKIKLESPAGSSQDSSLDLQIRKKSTEPNDKVIRSPSVVMLRKLDGNFFTENIDAHIEIELSDDPTETVDFVSNPEYFIDEKRIVLSFNADTKKTLVTRESANKNSVNEKVALNDSVYMKRQTEPESPKTSSAPVKKLIIPNANKPTIINTEKVFKEKKKVGRPRKHFELKPKRPVGRPRKNTYPAAEASIKIPEMSFPTMVDFANKSMVVDRKILNGSPSPGERKRGRPKGSKDTKPRKIRTDRQHIIREPQMQTPMLSPKGNGRFFLSPPSMIATAKRERIRNEILETFEMESLQEKLNDGASWIPPNKQELYSLILDEINRRIASQSFNML